MWLVQLIVGGKKNPVQKMDGILFIMGQSGSNRGF